MPTFSRLGTPILASLACLIPSILAAAPAPASLAGATALVVQPENSYNGYDFTLYAALMRRGFEVTQGLPEDLADAAKLSAYDLVATNLKRSFTPDQVAELKAYVAAGGAMYGNWGGPVGCPPALSPGRAEGAWPAAGELQ
jgi:hypothetical protein